MKVQKTFALKAKYNSQQIPQRSYQEKTKKELAKVFAIKKSCDNNQLGTAVAFSKTQTPKNMRKILQKTQKSRLKSPQTRQNFQILCDQPWNQQDAAQSHLQQLELLENKNVKLQKTVRLLQKQIKQYRSEEQNQKKTQCRCSQKLFSHINVLKHYLKSSVTVSKQTILYILGVQSASEFKNQFAINQSQTTKQVIDQLNQKIRRLTDQNEQIKQNMLQIVTLDSQQLKAVQVRSYFQNQMKKFFSSLELRNSCIHECLSGFDMRIDKIQANIEKFAQSKEVKKVNLKSRLQNLDSKCFNQNQSELFSCLSQNPNSSDRNQTDRDKCQLLSTSRQNGDQTLRRKNKQSLSKCENMQDAVLSFSFGQGHHDCQELFEKLNQHCTDSRATVKQKDQLLLQDFIQEDLVRVDRNVNVKKQQFSKTKQQLLSQIAVLQLQNQEIKLQIKQKNSLLNEKIKKILVQQNQINFLKSKIDQIMQLQQKMQQKRKLNYNFSFQAQQIREILLSCNPTNFQQFQNEFKQIITQRDFLSDKIMNFKKTQPKQNRNRKHQLEQQLNTALKNINILKQKNNDLQHERNRLKLRLQSVQGQLQQQKASVKCEESSISITLSDQIIDTIQKITENGPAGYEGLQWQLVVQKCIFEVAQRLRILSQQMSTH